MNKQFAMKSRLNSGFSLIEVLISLLVLGIGLLGLGSLQVTSVKGSENAHSRNVANMLAFNLADRMRSNPLGVAAGAYDLPVNCTTNERQCRVNTFCDPTQVARYDVQEVMCGSRITTRRDGGVANLLVAGTLDVSCAGACGAPNMPHVITIGWGQRRVNKNQSVDAVNRLNNLTIAISVIP